MQIFIQNWISSQRKCGQVDLYLKLVAFRYLDLILFVCCMSVTFLNIPNFDDSIGYSSKFATRLNIKIGLVPKVYE